MLRWCIYHRENDIVKKLISMGANVYADNAYIFCSYVSMDDNDNLDILDNNIKMLQYIVDNNVDICYSDNIALKFSVYYGNLETTKFLFKYSSNVNIADLLFISVIRNKPIIVKYLFYDGDSDSVILYQENYNTYINAALVLSCAFNHLKIIKLLVNCNADIHIHDDYLLELATVNFFTKLICYLLNNDANINVLNKYTKSLGSLHDSINLLNEYGLDANGNSQYNVEQYDIKSALDLYNTHYKIYENITNKLEQLLTQPCSSEGGG